MISTKHRLIFIHIPKTAGISVSDALLANPALEMQSFEAIGMRPHHCQDASTVHTTARHVRDFLSAEEYDKYRVFAVVRNPWSWLVSRYFHALRDARYEPELAENKIIPVRWLPREEPVRWWGENLSCNEYLRAIAVARHPYNYQHEYIVDEAGRQIVSHILKMESLQEGLSALSRELRIPDIALRERLNVGADGNFTQYYDEETIELVRRNFDRDIRMFGYDFDSET
jgi:sulfotransferase famil protein